MSIKRKPDTRKRIPNFKSEAEEARFWDTHDLMDYLHDTVEADDIVFLPPQRLSIDVPRTLWSKLLTLSRRKRTTPDKLVKRWVRENLSKAGQE